MTEPTDDRGRAGPPTLDRRRLLLALGAGTGAALAGCGQAEPSMPNNPSPDHTETPMTEPEQQTDSELDPLAQYAFDKTLKFTITGFYEVADTFAGVDDEAAVEVTEAAVAVIKRARDALAADAFQDRRAFTAAVLDLARLEASIETALADGAAREAPVASAASHEAYRAKLSGVLEALPTDADGRLAADLPEGYEEEIDVTRLAVCQDQAAEAGAWLERADDPATMTLPGGEEVSARIIDLSVDT